MKPQLLRYSALFLLCSTLLGCGFQLRGTGLTGTMLPDDWKSMYLVTSNPNSELSREVTTRFAANGITWQARDAAVCCVGHLRPWGTRYVVGLV